MTATVKTVNGYQAICHDYTGQWHRYWFEARLDAIAHNLTAHDADPHIPATNWLDILKGPHDDRPVPGNADRAGADPADA